mgnify:CR=1 FL=1
MMNTVASACADKHVGHCGVTVSVDALRLIPIVQGEGARLILSIITGVLSRKTVKPRCHQRRALFSRQMLIMLQQYRY